MGRLAAIIFDCDGVLVDTEFLKYQAWMQALKAHQIDFTLEDYMPLVGGSSKNIMAAIANEKQLTLDQDKLIKNKNGIYEKLQLEGVPPIPDAINFLNKILSLKIEYRIKIGLASSASRQEILENLKQMGVNHQQFDEIISGSDDLKDIIDPEGTNKPKPYIYKRIAERLGVNPKECLVFEDSAAGVNSAADAGMVVIATPNRFTENHDFSKAMEISNFSEITIEKLLQKMNLLLVGREIRDSYPNLETTFNGLDISIKGDLNFDLIVEQLTWASNEYEKKRAIHRLHCVLASLTSQNVSYFERLSAEQKQALIVLTILDGCKNSEASVKAYENLGFVALKDGVPSLFDMLRKAPEIFPVYNRLTELSKQVIMKEFFYLHLRHLQLGEVPVASIPQDSLKKPRDLMVAFWYANSMGFNLEKLYSLGEKTGPTISDGQKASFKELIDAIDSGNLSSYYLKNSIFDKKPVLKVLFSEQEIEFICRLGKMLSFVNLQENDKSFALFVYANSELIKMVSSLESKMFSEYRIEAFTFLPAVLEALTWRIMPGQPVGEILRAFLSLQKQLYLSVPHIVKDLGNNRTVPLFSLSQHQDDMLIKFTSSSDKELFHFEASVRDFIKINMNEGPVPNAVNENREKKYIVSPL
jgi:beta-phosphoglucomutase